MSDHDDSTQADLLTSLPTELILHIFDYLPVEYTWSLRSVNRQWNTFLSTKELVQSTIAKWQTHDPSDSGFPPESTQLDTTEVKIAQIQALCSKQHCAARILDTGHHTYNDDYVRSGLHLKGSKIAYFCCSREATWIEVRDLVSGDLELLQKSGYNMERDNIVLTTRFTAIVAGANDHDFLLVFKHSESPKDCIEFHLAGDLCPRMCAVGGDGDIIVVAVKRHVCTEEAHVSELVIYDTQLQQSRTLPLGSTVQKFDSRGRRRYSCSLLVDSKRHIIDVFYLAVSQRNPPHPAEEGCNTSISHSRFAFDGQLLHENTWEDDVEYQREKEGRPALRDGSQYCKFTMSIPQPTGKHDQFRIMVSEGMFTYDMCPRTSFGILFDAAKGQFLPGMNTHRVMPEFDDEDRDMRVVWKEKLYCTTPDPLWKPAVVCMNETFLVALEMDKNAGMKWYQGNLVSPARIKVLSFDPLLSLDSE